MFKKSALTLAVASVAAMSGTAQASDKDLLDVLYQNGTLNKAQYEKLIKQAAEKEAAAPVASAEKLKAMDWASRVKIGGDMRARFESVDNEASIKKHRQRIRARLKVDAQVNDEVKAGVRLVTTGGRTSTNQSLGDSGSSTDGFKGKAVYLDRAFITWTPEFAHGASLTAGKFAQQWFRVSNNVWDSDVNPEGLSVKYSHKIGPAKITANGGYYILSDNGDDGSTFSEDLIMYHGGLSGKAKITDAVKVALGGNAYIYNENAAAGVNQFAGDRVNGDMAADFELYEVAGKVDVDTGIVPLQFYANYVTNEADSINEGEDEAWLAGVATKWNGFKLKYDYRDTQKNAVPDTFNDSDFSRGATGARGHTIKLSYKLSKNFSVGGAYMGAEDYTATPGQKIDINTFQLDLKAKF